MFLVLSRCSSITRYPNLHQLSIIAHCRTKSESRVLAIVQGARRFILYNKWVIENCPLQVYASALVFGPANSFLAGRQAGGVGIGRRHSQALGRGHGSGAADARGPFALSQLSRVW